VADVLVILPTYNELESLPSILGRLRQSLPEADVLVVDDSSPDGTPSRSPPKIPA
jgi:dolichol-phosphate mannosyltransferase